MPPWLYQIFHPLQRLLQRLLRAPSIGVKALVINQNQQVLLVEHHYVQGWHLPGGGIKYGESPQAAVMRELKEETGIVAKNTVLFAIYTHQILGAKDYPILYLIREFEIHPTKVSLEIKNVQWFDLDRLPAGVTAATQRRLEEFAQKSATSEAW